ncbi:MAG TPA: PqqD family protein [Tepidisphaeraceae bacterium]|jgi:hypothetical protein|nr:PqqD family protein [Tepidisphaeraceae bacterium]
MMPFRSKPKQKTPTREEALSVKPLRLVEADVQPDGKGGAKLKVPLQQSKWSGMFFKLPSGATKTFELDEIGLLVWNGCDGKTPVKRLVETVAKQYGVSPREAEVSTFAFLQTLMKKNLIGLTTEKQ